MKCAMFEQSWCLFVTLKKYFEINFQLKCLRFIFPWKSADPLNFVINV
jgi:hypothetical protein